LSFQEGYSTACFLISGIIGGVFSSIYVAADFPVFPDGACGKETLNTFAYTCSYSVCAAKAGARVTSLDLSRKYLEWGKRNFALNDLDPGEHDFIYGDVFDWLRRLRENSGDSTRLFWIRRLSRPRRRMACFASRTDYGKLVELALPLLKAEAAFCSPRQIRRR
jgi:23S rRNA (cytosine1962-C5)-methyltransferase